MVQTPLASRAAGWRRLFAGVRNGKQDPEKRTLPMYPFPYAFHTTVLDPSQRRARGLAILSSTKWLAFGHLLATCLQLARIAALSPIVEEHQFG